MTEQAEQEANAYMSGRDHEAQEAQSGSVGELTGRGLTPQEGKTYENLALYQGGKDLADLSLAQQEASSYITGRGYNAQEAYVERPPYKPLLPSGDAMGCNDGADGEAAQRELRDRLATIMAQRDLELRRQRVNPELMVHGHVKQGDPEPVTIYKSDPDNDGKSDLYQTAVQVGDTTHLIDIDFTQPGMSDEVLLAIVYDRLESTPSILFNPELRYAKSSIRRALALLNE